MGFHGMTRFLYYIPSGSPCGEALVRGAGLWDRFESMPDHVSVGVGPDGAAGYVLSPAGGVMARYRPTTQAWSRSPCGTWWLGYATDEVKPGPVDLVRRERVDGYGVRLGDEAEWTVPIARSVVHGTTTLPQALVLGPDGQLMSEVLPRYLPLCADAGRLFELLGSAGEGGGEVKVADAWGIAARALSVNYRVGPEEVSALRLLTTVNLWAVLKSLLDLPAAAAVEGELKKKGGTAATGGGPATSGGSGAASGVTTTPPSPSSGGCSTASKGGA